MNKHLKQLKIIGIILAVVLIIGFSYNLIFKDKEDMKSNSYVEELKFKGENPSPIFTSGNNINITIDPEVAVVFQTSNGLGYARHDMKVCNSNMMSINPSLNNIGLRFNQEVQDLKITEVKYENTITSQTPKYINQIAGLYPNGSNIINTIITYQNNYGYQYINYPLITTQAQLNNQYVYYVPISLDAGICRDYIIEYKPSERDDTLKWDAYVWQGALVSPTTSLLLDPNWVLGSGGNFQILTYTGDADNDGQNISLTGSSNGTGYAYSVNYCPDGNDKNWTLATWNTPVNYGIAQTEVAKMIFYLQMNETGTVSLNESINNDVQWVKSGTSNHISYDCIFGNCINSTATNSRWDRAVADYNDTENNDISIEVWGKLYNLDCGGGDECTIYSYRSLDLQDYLQLFVTENTGLITCDLYSSPTANRVQGGFVKDSKWHHYYCQIGSDGMKLYVDGRLVSSNAITNKLTSKVYEQNKLMNYGNDDKGWIGTLDEFILRTGGNAYLTSSQIQQHYQEGIARINISARFSNSNTTNVHNWVGLTNGQTGLNSTSKCVQYLYKGIKLNLTVNDPYLLGINFTYANLVSAPEFTSYINVSSQRLYTSTGLNYTDENLILSFIPLSVNLTNFWVNITWIEDDINNLSFKGIEVTNNTVSNLELNNMNTTKGDNWTAQITVYAKENRGSFNVSSLIILNKPPTMPTINYPIDNLVTGNYTVNLSCSGSDADNDLINYEFYADRLTTPVNLIQNMTLIETQFSFNDSDGIYYWRCRANDNMSVSGSSPARQINLTRQFILSNITSVNATVTEGSLQNYIINITKNMHNVKDIDAIFVYNASSITVTKTEEGTGRISYRSSLIVPSVPVSGTQKNYYWTFSIEQMNGTIVYNSSHSGSQEVLSNSNVTVSSGCPPGYFTSLYFDLKKEVGFDTLTGNITYNVIYGLSNISQLVIFGSLNNVNNVSICLNSTESYINYGEIQYETQDYLLRRFYIFSGYRIENITINNTLYNLELLSATPFMFTVKDTSLNPYSNHYLALMRWYPNINEYRIVEMGKTDEKGQTILRVKTLDVDYRIALYTSSGTLVKLFDPTRFNCLTYGYSTASCEYNLFVSAEDIDYTSETKIESSLTFNPDTKIFTFIWNDPSQTTNEMNMTVYKMGLAEALICSDSATGFTGVLSCDISSYTGTFRAEVMRSASPFNIFSELIASIGETISDISPATGLMLLLALLLILSMIGFYINPILGVIFAVMTFIPAYYLGIVGLITTIGVAILGFIVIHFMRRST